MSRIKIIPLFFFVIFVKQLLWVAFIPLWQFPDEQAHFAQIQNYAEGKGLSFFAGPGTSREIYESEKIMGTARDEFGNNKFTYHPEYNIPYIDGVMGKYETQIKEFPPEFRTDLVIAEATGYPPLYYILGALFYRLGFTNDIITRVFLVRVFNLILFTATIYVTYLIGKLLFGKDKIVSLTLPLIVAFHPMLSFVFGGVNSDNLFNLLFTVAIYVSLRIINQGINFQLIFLSLATIISGYWTKPQGRILLLVFAFPFAFQILRLKRYKKIVFASIIVFLILILSPIFIAFSKGEQFIPDVAHSAFSLNTGKITLIDHIRYTLRHTYREVLPWYWGVFRWLSFTYPRIVHRVINVSILLSLIGLFKIISDLFFHKKTIVNLSNFLFLIYVSIVYFLAISSFDFLFTRSWGYSIGIQGRYFFPTVVAHMALLLIGITTLLQPITKNRQLLKYFGLSFILLHSYVFVFLIFSYFSRSSISLFFQQASQYKPYFFKSPVLEIMTVAYVVIVSLLSFKFIFSKNEKH